MIDDMIEALNLLKEYCENYTCYSCMMYKPDSIYDIDNSDEE